MSGTLYIVATPIGNLADITYRAVETLKNVDLIACEDTRQTRKLLDHYGIDRPLTAYHEHNEAEQSATLLDRIENGLNLALVSDAGTPLVSDPGYRLARGAVEREIPIIPIPGASAILTSLAASGFPTDDFRFGGFLPRKSGERQRWLTEAAETTSTLIVYEAPHRIIESLHDIEEALGDPLVVIGRELTKLHEEFLRGRASTIRQTLEQRPAIKGEMTVLIDLKSRQMRIETTIVEAVLALEKSGVPRMDAIKRVARDRGLPKRDVYREIESRIKT